MINYSEGILMRILICDDDKSITIQLEKILKDFFQNNSLKQPDTIIYNCGEDLLLDTGEKDIVFLDVEMPGISGIFAGNELKKQNDKIIIFIITSFSEYLDDAMRFHVFRYLSKPLDKQRIFRNMKDALELYNTTCRKIPIETRDGVFTISTSDIILIEVSLHKVTVHTVKKDFISIHNIQYWKDTLNMPCFFSPHRSFIVNFDHICDFNHSLIHLYNNNFTAYLTRRKYKEFKDAYLMYLESTR